MRYGFLLILLGISGVASAQLPDSVVSRYRQRGFFLATNRAEPPFRAYKLGENGSLTIGGESSAVYYLDLQGRIIPGSPFDADSRDFDAQGYALVKKNNRAGMINQQGHQVLPFQYEELVPLHHPRQWLAARINGRWGVLDATGQLVVQPVYDEVKPFSEGMAAVKQGAKWGFIGEDGQEKIRPTYAYIWQDFSEGFAAVSTVDDHSVGFITPQNQAITAFTYAYPLCLNRDNAHFRDVAPYYRFHRGFALVRNKRCEIGVLNTRGQEVLPLRFHRVAFTDSTIVGYRGKQQQVYRLPH
ncbi:WG repeat-containing protein [Hymenobacter perfusus]|uniref:WG repeat-containing protein n=1 Tax=Hymenobacter perfusus TaxID=1236770 RepID=A0A428K7C3_9BACT|nr:WG repeat-containing protein [Hymenobacter perfusus]RSK42388.1 WG repeat-containing protein [Hymenobacter perfusus]